ncbi:MAG: M50 family metallopeptidase [Bdellovibrionales bacterium]|nr:M50 family metallopeptidase [Bdellovibrionales bacterium]
MGLFSSSRKKKKEKHGGIAFFSSLFFLLFLSSIHLFLLPGLLDSYAFLRASRFIGGIILGLWFAHQFIRGHLSVLLHEYKHAIVSGLVGNKWKGMKVKSDSGHFQYAYSKDTASYNAFISLAPYYTPLLLTPALILGLIFEKSNVDIALFMVGIGYGIDLLINTRDISPAQTDFSNLTGGYKVGIFYVFAMNLFITTTLLSWIFQGGAGIKLLGYGLWSFMTHVAAYYYS